MFAPRLITALLSFTSAALAMPKVDVTLDTKDISTNTTCWVGNTHSVCDGHDNGCTPDGIYVSSNLLPRYVWTLQVLRCSLLVSQLAWLFLPSILTSLKKPRILTTCS